MFKDIFREGARSLSSISFGGDVLNGEQETTFEMYETKTSESNKCEDVLRIDMADGKLTAGHGGLPTLPYHIIDKHWQWVSYLDLSYNCIR